MHLVPLSRRANRSRKAVLNVGGGIVADSSPEAEYRETVVKASPLLASLEPSMRTSPVLSLESPLESPESSLESSPGSSLVSQESSGADS